MFLLRRAGVGNFPMLGVASFVARGTAQPEDASLCEELSYYQALTIILTLSKHHT